LKGCEVWYGIDLILFNLALGLIVCNTLQSCFFKEYDKMIKQ